VYKPARRDAITTWACVASCPCAACWGAHGDTESPGGLAGFRAGAFHEDKAGEEIADLVGQFGVAGDVLAERRVFALAVALDELLGELVQRIDFGAGCGHGVTSLPESSQSSEVLETSEVCVA